MKSYRLTAESVHEKNPYEPESFAAKADGKINIKERKDARASDRSVTATIDPLCRVYYVIKEISLAETAPDYFFFHVQLSRT